MGLTQLTQHFKVLVSTLTYSRKQCTTAFVGLAGVSRLSLVIFGKNSRIGHVFLRLKPQLFES